MAYAKSAPLTLLVAAWVGCQGGAPSPTAPVSGEAQAVEPVPGLDKKPASGPNVETGRFALSVAPSQPSYPIGEAGEVKIKLEGRGDWHVNQEYPMKVVLAASDGIKIDKMTLSRSDAKSFGEDEVLFLARLEPAVAGDHDVECDVSFAMCTEENCILERETLAMRLKAK